MSNIFLSQLAADKTIHGRKTPARKSSVTSRRRSGYGLENDGVAVPGENDQPEELIEAEAAINSTDEVMATHNEVAIDDAGTEVAIEALRHTMAMSLRSAFALEDLAEQLEGTLDDGGDGIDETTAQLLSTAIAPSAGEDVIATESFGRNSRIATESMIDTVRDKAKNYYASVASTITNVLQTTSQTIRSAIDGLRNSQKVMAEMKQKISILDDHAGKEITNEVQLKQLNNYFNGMSGDAVTGVLTVINKNLPTMVNSANAIFEATAQLASALEDADEKTVSREAKRFFDNARKFAERAPKTLGFNSKFPENYDLETLASPETAKSSLGHYDKSMDDKGDTSITFKIIDATAFDKLESGLGTISESSSQLMEIATKKLPRIVQIVKALAAKSAASVKSGVKAGMKKVGMGKEEEPDTTDTQLRKAIANVLVAANMICRDSAAACRATAITCEKGTLMLVRASLRMAAMEAKGGSTADTSEQE